MPSPSESRRALSLVAGSAASAATQVLAQDSAGAQRAAVLDLVPGLISYYSDGSAALAADFYEDEREMAGAGGRFSADLVLLDRSEKIGRALAWATEPLLENDNLATVTRLTSVVEHEVAKPFRDTVTTNSRRDPASVGWRRISGGGCKFCRMLADRGAVYREATAQFASHKHCKCSAAPVFEGQDGPEADIVQYVASQKRRSEKQQEALRRYLASMPD